MMTKSKRVILSLILLTVLCCTAVITIVMLPLKLLSPLPQFPSFQFLQTTEPDQTGSQKIIYGFLPFWNLKKTTLQPELTHLAYFSVPLNSDGSIQKEQDGNTVPGYHQLRSSDFATLRAQQEERNRKVELVLTQFKNDDIRELLLSRTAHQNTLRTIDSLLATYSASGINIDIEYSGEVTEELRAGLVQLMKKIDVHLETKHPEVKLSIDMYPGAATRNQIWDVAAIEPHVDYIIIMTYDFHRSSSSVAGPVAPLFGGSKLWSSDVIMHLKEFLKIVPSKKILLGIPFYGYEWQVTSFEPQSPVYPRSGATASYKRVQELIQNKQELGLEEKWNEDALSPYITYTKNRQNFIVYYENSRSVSYKLDLVNQLELGGIAIWALGYEQDYRELWDIIKRKL